MPHNSLHSHPFVAGIQANWGPDAWTSATLLVAVSGGPDSVAVLRAMQQIIQTLDETLDEGMEMHVAHFNHRWRGEASDQNERFVVSLCEQLAIPIHLQRSTNLEKKEEIARAERYEFLRTTAERLSANYVLLGHNANDQAETILHRIIRGTALRGLAGIPLERSLGEARIRRPILWATREEVICYLNDIQQPFCIDDSNQDIRFTRNRIRHELIPLLEQQYNPAVVQSLLRLGEVAREVNQYLADQVEQKLARCIVREDVNFVELHRQRIQDLPLPLRKQMLVEIWQRQGWPEQSMGFDQWNQIVQAIDLGGKVCLRGNTRINSERHVIRLTRFES